MSSGLLRFSTKHLMARWSRSLLTVASVVIGVAAIAAVEMTAEATRHAYRAMFATVNGKSGLEIKGAADTAFDRAIIDEIRTVPGVQFAAPTLLKFVQINSLTRTVPELDDDGNPTGKTLPLKTRVMMFGIDPAVDQKLRDYQFKAEDGGRMVAAENELVLEEHLAEAFGVKVGEEVEVLSNLGLVAGQLPRLKLVGIAAATQPGQTSRGGLAIVNLATAQRFLLAKSSFVVDVPDPDDEEEANQTPAPDRIHSIQVVPDPKVPLDALQKAIAAKLPPGLSCTKPESRTQALDATMHGTQQGLHVTTRFSLMLGAFIIFNTMLMNVSERRKQIAIVRAIGATQSQVFWMIVRESLLIGVIGSAVGLLLGYLGARLITETLASATDVDIPVAQLTWQTSFWSVLFGMGMALLGSAVPAYEASRLSPQESMSAAVHSPGTRDLATRQTVWGLVLGAAGALWLYLCVAGFRPMEEAINGGMALVLSALLLLHNLMAPLSAIASVCLKPIFGISSSLAHRQLMRNRTRTSITAGVLFIACATGIGMAHTILDNVEDVRSWYKQVLTGDFFVRTMLPDPGTGDVASVPDDCVAEIRKVKGIKIIDTTLFQKIKARRPMQAGDPGEQPLEQVYVVARDLPDGTPLALDLVAGSDPSLYGDGLRKRLVAGDVALGSVFAGKSGLAAGDSVEIDTPSGLRKLRIAAVVNDYLSGGLTVWMSQKTAHDVLGSNSVGGVIVFCEEGQSENVRTALKPLCAKYNILLHSFADVKQKIEEIIGGTDKCLWALIILGFIVAAFGMINTLTMNVIEQTREIGMLRTIAMTRGQVRWGIVAQALIMSMVGLVPGILAGLGVTYLLNIAAQKALAHDIVYHARPDLAIGTFVGALVLTIIAALLPANRAANLAITDALQYE